MFEAPLTFTEAVAMLTARLDTPTALKHKEIAATWDADFRHRAFFSARVTEATVLSELHNRVQAVLDGKMTDKQAVALLRDYFVGPGADPLAKMGFAPKAGARTIAELASLPRLQLIVETNVRMAQECGHYQQWAESAAYYRYGVWRCGYAEEHREEHLARDGKVYAFDHPIWTQSPPGGEFNCHCYREIASEDEIMDMGLAPEPPSSPFEPSSLGFDPSRGMADPPPFGKRVRPEYREKAEDAIKEYEEVDNREAQAKLDAIKEEWGKHLDEVEAAYEAKEEAARKRSEAAKKAAATRKANKLAAEKDAAEAEANRQAQSAASQAFPAPEDLPGLQVVGNPGGTTGAKIVQDNYGNRYIRKTGGTVGGEPEAHLRNECAADAAYQAMGVQVPEFRLYETAAGPVKLARFIPDAQSLSAWWDSASEKDRQLMRAKMREGFDADVLFGNWDVAGELADNILIDKEGTPWRIDNGGAFGFRAQGKRKDDKDWAAGWPDDLFTMSASPNNKRFFADVTPRMLADSISGRDWDKTIVKLPPGDQAVIARRLKEIRELDVRGKDFIQSGYTGEYTDRIIVHSYNLSKEDFREEVPATVSPGNFGFCRSGTPAGAPATPEKAKEADFKNKLLEAVKTVNNHNGPVIQGKSGSGDKKPNMVTVDAALALRPELQKLAAAGNDGAKYYLECLKKIEQAAKNGGSVAQLSFQQEIFRAPATTAAAASKYKSLTDHIHDYMKRNGGDTQFIMEWQGAQGGNSYAYKACEFKVAHLRARGVMSMAEAKKKGYYTGFGKLKQEKNLKEAFSTLSKDQKSLDLYVESASQYQAAIQLLMENADFEGRDAVTRTVILGRTEEIGKVVTVGIGELSPHARGAAESHSIFRAVVVEAGNDPGITIARVPYPRISGCYFLERTPGKNDGMFLGDGENEFNADTHGLPVLFLGSVKSGTPLAPFRDKLLQFEKTHLK